MREPFLYGHQISSRYLKFISYYSASEHEKEVGRIAESLGFTHISLSSDVMAMEKIVPRGFTGDELNLKALLLLLSIYCYCPSEADLEVVKNLRRRV